MGDQTTGGLLSPWLKRQRFLYVSKFVTGNVLDFGCGTGDLLQYTNVQGYYGFDIDVDSVQIARASYPQFRFSTQLPDLQENRAGFNTIVMTAVIEHVPSPKDTLSLLKNYLAPDGVFIITTPHRAFNWIHTAGSKLGIFSREANQQHNILFDHNVMMSLARETSLGVKLHARFLGGANQFFLLEQKISDHK